MINKKDKYTYGHTERVVIYSKWFAEFLGLSEEEKIDIKLAAYLHDIGKVELPEELLNKRTKLTDDEFSKIKEQGLQFVAKSKSSSLYGIRSKTNSLVKVPTKLEEIYSDKISEEKIEIAFCSRKMVRRTKS